MGLFSSINVALSGIRTSQASIDLVSRNVANANTPGYTKKVLPQENLVANGEGYGVRSQGAVRQIDIFLQQQIRTQNATAGSLDVLNHFMQRVDAMFGAPEDETSIAGKIDELAARLQELTTDPSSAAVRQAVVNEAGQTAQLLNSMTKEVQQMRLEAETNIAGAVDDINALLKSIADINTQVSQRQDGSLSTADLEDQRDNAINKLSHLMDIRVVSQDDGSVSVFTSSGFLLADRFAQELDFDARTSVDPSSRYSNDPTQRTLGTISVNSGGVDVDLIAAGAFQGGKIGGFLEIRDETMVEMQAQLDELAAGLALTMLETTVDGAAVTAGVAAGFDIDTADMLPGNKIHLNYTVTPPGTPTQVSIVAVDDPATLPLGNGATANPGDQVIGINFNQPMANIIADLQAALPPEVVVSNPAGDTIRFLDDGAAGTSDINAVSATVTASGFMDQGTGMPMFVDGASNTIYSGSLDGQTQKLGFAGRIQVNDALKADPSLLVVYESAPATEAGDNTRPLDLIARLTENDRAYHPDSGIGGDAAPFTGSIDAFARRLISYQGSQVEAVARDHETSTMLRDTLQTRFDDATGVNVDEEMANLLVLQNAFAANARVITVVQELFQTLMMIGR